MNKKFSKQFYIYLLVFLVLIGIYAFGSIKNRQSNKSTALLHKATIAVNNKSANKKSVKVQNPYKDIVISSVGDCTLGTDERFSVTNTMPEVFNNNNKDYNYFFKNVLDIFKSDDITTGNLETTLTTAKVRADKQYTFKAPPDYVNVLKNSSIEGVNISNNHIYDYLQQGFDDTINTLETAGINYFGENNKWLTEVKGIKVGFLGYTAFSYDNNYLEKVKQDISDLKSKGASFVIINFHWGTENSYYPNSIQKYIAHYAIDNGADLIIGHHPHVIEGLETYKGKTICYSLGNFCFGGNTNPKDKNTFIFQGKFRFSNSSLVSYEIRIIPCSISSVNYVNDYCPTPLKDNEKSALIAKINSLSTNISIPVSDEFVEIKQ